MKRTKRLTRCGLLAALALILSYLESLLPAFFAVPGMKLGLANLAVLAALYLLGSKSAMAVNLVRIFLAALLFGSAMSLAFSLAGGMLSTLVMIGLKRTGKFHLVTVSVVGGLTHDLGQILAAMLLLETASLGWYLPVLWLTGLAAGALIGLLGGLLCNRLVAFGWGDTP